MKRKINNSEFPNKKSKSTFSFIDEKFVSKCQDEFNQNNINILAKNAVTNIGALYASTDNDEARKVSHVFLNTIKKKNLKCTNQGASGRCWLFSGLNMFRHNVIKALELENFEFSETHLFFWDKFERSNSYLQWFNDYIDTHDKIDSNDDLFKYLVKEDEFMSDGGYFNYFTNLVTKYGLIPKNAMPETFQSGYSSDMNDILMDVLHASSCRMIKFNKNRVERSEIIEKTLKQIYNILVKFLGEPPKTFDWAFTNEEGEANIISGLTPMTFKEMTIPGLDMKDFVLLTDMSDKDFKYYEKYKINYTNNVLEGEPCEMINLPITELKKYVKKSVLSGFPVWFAADVGKFFHPEHSSLDEKVINYDLTFGEKYEMNKGERYFFSNQKICHAMTFVGLNVDDKDKTVNFSVENSWNFIDNETPGLDGFLTMSDSWFDNYVGMIAVHRKYLTRNIQNLFDKEPISIDPWKGQAPAVKINHHPYKQNLLMERFLNQKI